MNIEHRISLSEEELKEALLAYVNKTEGTTYVLAANIKVLNGSSVEDVCMTGLLFSVGGGGV